MIDMDISSGPPTRSVTPQPTIKEEEGDLSARKAGLGSLMKSAKHDVKVPEFDMGAFF